MRVSSDDQVESGAGLEVQRRAIREACVQRGWVLLSIFEDAAASGGSLARRGGLQDALRAVEEGAADTLVVAKVDRLSRSLLDFSGLMQRSRDKGWSLGALDLGVDTSTSAGEMLASILAVFAQFERRLIGERTKSALAVKKAEGIKLGRRSTLPPAVRERIISLREADLSLQAIADILTYEGHRTGQGGKRWYPSTVRAVLATDRVERSKEWGEKLQTKWEEPHENSRSD